LTPALWFAPVPAVAIDRVAKAFRIERRLPAGRDEVALTFDDGPHAQGTPAVLAALAAAGAHATFFLVGEQVERERALAAEIKAAGHEIAVHGYRHLLLLRRRVRALADDLERAIEVIGEATGEQPACYRPPYGIFSGGGLEVVRGRGWRPVLWSRWGRDWTRTATASSIAALATRDLRDGDIVLLHDADHYSVAGSWQKTAAALPRILETVGQRGLACARLTGSRAPARR
jgi:peptidoglycan/xylan/chitin deacetylase (PgdA/CDA1 family)